MLPQAEIVSQGGTPTPVRIGVGIDTARYGHYAAFVRADLQPAAAELPFAESAAGYALLRQRFEQIASRYGAVHFVVRLDAAGQYADNLLHFVQALGTPHATSTRPADAAPLATPGADATRRQRAV